MAPETLYAKGPDGLIAYQVLGDGPFDLVYLSGAISHIDIRWESPRSSRFLERLASFSRLISFDRRGIGASDPVSAEALPTWEHWAEDLTVVLDAVESEKAAIVALVDGATMALLFAATHPQEDLRACSRQLNSQILGSRRLPRRDKPRRGEPPKGPHRKGLGNGRVGGTDFAKPG